MEVLLSALMENARCPTLQEFEAAQERIVWRGFQSLESHLLGLGVSFPEWSPIFAEARENLSTDSRTRRIQDIENFRKYLHSSVVLTEHTELHVELYMRVGRTINSSPTIPPRTLKEAVDLVLNSNEEALSTEEAKACATAVWSAGY